MGLAYITFWGSVWDNTSDGLSSLIISGQAAVVAVGVGMVMTAILQGGRRLVGVLFIAVVRLVLPNIRVGLGRLLSRNNGATGRTQIAGALDQFQEREGHYPETLATLRPRDLLFIWQPVILSPVGTRGVTREARIFTGWRPFTGNFLARPFPCGCMKRRESHRQGRGNARPSWR